MKMSLGLVLLLLTAVAFGFQSDGETEDEQFVWRTDLATALIDAREAARPLLIVFR